MGHTHHWENHEPIDEETWKAITASARRILTLAQENRGIALSEEYDINDIPVVNDEEIRFNGYNDEGHETFYATRRAQPYAFCKTARKPYDPVVVAILHAFGVHHPSFVWFTDGRDPEDHRVGLKLYNEANGAGWENLSAVYREAS